MRSLKPMHLSILDKIIGEQDRGIRAVSCDITAHFTTNTVWPKKPDKKYLSPARKRREGWL